MSGFNVHYVSKCQDEVKLVKIAESLWRVVECSWRTAEGSVALRWQLKAFTGNSSLTAHLLLFLLFKLTVISLTMFSVLILHDNLPFLHFHEFFYS